MKRNLLGLLAVLGLMVGGTRGFAQDAMAVIDKAIKAHGGEEALGKIKAYSWEAKAKMFFGGNESAAKLKQTVRGLDHFKQEFEGDFGGNAVSGVSVLAKDKAWINFNGMGGPMDETQTANAIRGAYINGIAVTILPLKGKEFKTTLAGEEKVGDKPAIGVKATGPDGKDVTLYFDKESGLLVKLVAEGMAGFGGDEFKQEVLLSDYKEAGGIKKAMKSKVLRNGEAFIDQEMTEFKVLDKVDDSTFAEPK